MELSFHGSGAPIPTHSMKIWKLIWWPLVYLFCPWFNDSGLKSLDLDCRRKEKKRVI